MSYMVAIADMFLHYGEHATIYSYSRRTNVKEVEVPNMVCHRRGRAQNVMTFILAAQPT